MSQNGLSRNLCCTNHWERLEGVWADLKGASLSQAGNMTANEQSPLDTTLTTSDHGTSNEQSSRLFHTATERMTGDTKITHMQEINLAPKQSQRGSHSILGPGGFFVTTPDIFVTTHQTKSRQTTFHILSVKSFAPLPATSLTELCSLLHHLHTRRSVRSVS